MSSVSSVFKLLSLRRKTRGGALKRNFIFKMRDAILTFMLQKRIDDQPTISREMVREAQDILHRHFKRVGLKQTAQRDTILRTFLETRDHLSTNELHRLVQKKDPASATPRCIAR